MKIRTMCLLILMAICPFILVGQASWTRITPTPQENHINDITKIPGTNKIIAICEGSTLMISNDLGETWQLILNPGGLPNNYPLKTVYFYNNSNGFIGGDYYVSNTIHIYYILKTTDGGLNWTANLDIPGTGYKRVYDFHFINDNIGYASGYHGKLIKTTDAGENWFDIESGVNFTLNSIDFYNDSSGYIVGESDTLLKTTDYGNTWTKEIFNSPSTGNSLIQIQFVNATNGYIAQNFGDILKTTDAGESWDIIFSDEDIHAYCFDFFDEDHGIVGCYQDNIQSCIISTIDGGDNWSVFTLPEFQWDNYSVCCFDESNSLFGGYQGSIFMSSDNGQSWESEFSRAFWGNIYQVQYIDENTLFCLATAHLAPPLEHSSILYKSDNGGLNFYPIADFIVLDENIQTEAAFHFLDQDIGYLTYYHNENLLTVLKTTDGGNSWVETESGNIDKSPHSICFFDEQNGLIAGAEIYGFILKTTDGGNTWIQTYDVPSTYQMMDIYYFTGNDIIVSASTYWYSMLSNLLISHDAGNTWEELILGSYGGICDIEVKSNTIYLACGDNAILKSPDGGDTWQYTQVNNSNDIEFHAIHFPTENIGFAVGSGNFETAMKTNNGGDTWEVIETGTTAGLNAVHFKNEDIGYIYGEKGLVLKTTNGGTTFINKSPKKKKESFFTSYPNPFSDNFTIQFHLPVNSKSYTIEITAQNGKRILNEVIKDHSSNLNIKSEKMKPGIYLVSLREKHFIIETQKIIKLP